MSPKTVYRSSHPATLAAWTAAGVTADEITEQRKAFLAEHGFEGRHIAIRDRWMIGVSHPESQDVPTGWRRDRDLAGTIVPARRTTPGKKIGARIDQLTMPDARKNLPGGMPDMVWGGDSRVYWPGMQLIGDTLYVTWGSEPKTEIDPEVWERVKLSEYYAAVEAEQAART